MRRGGEETVRGKRKLTSANVSNTRVRGIEEQDKGTWRVGSILGVRLVTLAASSLP